MHAKSIKHLKKMGIGFTASTLDGMIHLMLNIVMVLLIKVNNK